MTDLNTDCVNHLRVTFNLKAPVVDAFVQDQPHKKLNGLRALLDAYGAKVSSAGRMMTDPQPEGAIFKDLGDAVREMLGKEPALARKFNGEITVELEDDRNVKAFIASLELGPYDDVLSKKSIKIETHCYNAIELAQGCDGDGIVKPPFPPANARYVLE